jgi:hypothetical protein
MAKRASKSQPTWTDVKAKLAGFDRAALLGLVQTVAAIFSRGWTAYELSAILAMA